MGRYGSFLLCRPCESRDPYREVYPFRDMADALRNNQRRWLWVLLSQGRRRTGLPRPRQRAVDHGDRIRQPIDRDERAEARAFFLAEQHLIEHVEPVERNAGPAILALLYRVEERLAAADLLEPVLDLL